MCKDLQGLKFAVQNVSKATSLGDEGPQRWHLHLTSFSEEIRRNSGIAFKKSVDLKLKSESRMRNGVILCIDDERIVLNGLQSQLGRDFGNLYAIELAESGEEALELIAELLATGSEIPIVISDQLMPGIKGHEVLRRIHELSPATYTVLLTGQSDVKNDVAIGSGIMKWPEILRAAQKAGVKWYFIEDESPTSIEQIPVSMRFLELLRF